MRYYFSYVALASEIRSDAIKAMAAAAFQAGVTAIAIGDPASVDEATTFHAFWSQRDLNNFRTIYDREVSALPAGVQTEPILPEGALGAPAYTKPIEAAMTEAAMRIRRSYYYDTETSERKNEKASEVDPAIYMAKQAIKAGEVGIITSGGPYWEANKAKEPAQERPVYDKDVYEDTPADINAGDPVKAVWTIGETSYSIVGVDVGTDGSVVATGSGVIGTVTAASPTILFKQDLPPPILQP